MKKVYLTFDIETIVSGISRNDNYIAGVYLGAMYIAEELRKRNLKGTFFISLSSKQSLINQDEYIECIKWLINSLKSYSNIRIESHIHAYNLPVGFECNYDAFNKYNSEQQIELLQYARSYFESQGIEVKSFRPGGFSTNSSYYSSLKEAGYINSSILEKDKKANINLITGEITASFPYMNVYGITEYPITSVKLKSIKGKEEILNLSPDFFKLSSVKNQIDELEYLNINFHSFSIYLNRLIRENHDNLIVTNLKFLLFENMLKKLLSRSSIQLINSKTVMAKEFINWIDYIKECKYNTYFIGE